jgi:hypothetical protein
MWSRFSSYSIVNSRSPYTFLIFLWGESIFKVGEQVVLRQASNRERRNPSLFQPNEASGDVQRELKMDDLLRSLRGKYLTVSIRIKITPQGQGPRCF